MAAAMVCENCIVKDCWGTLKKECLKDTRSVLNECWLMNGMLLEAGEDGDEILVLGGRLECLYTIQYFSFGRQGEASHLGIHDNNHI